MADKKTQLMAQFYEQCKSKGYTDMHDATQSLKAKVIAVDLGLKYGNIVSFYENAEKCYQQIENEKEEARRQDEIRKRQQQEEAKRRAVKGELLAEISDCDDTSNPKATVLRVYIRPDRTIYTTRNGSASKTEGAPSLSVKKGELMLFKYHPSQAVYTGASVGGVSMGGVHYTQDGYSYNSLKSEKADVVVTFGSTSFTVSAIVISDYAANAFRRDPEYKSLRSPQKIICHNNEDTSYILKAGLSSGDYATKMYAVSKAADERRLPGSTCAKIANLVGRMVNGNFPPSDEEIYVRADLLAQNDTSDQLKQAAEMFRSISDYKDASARARELDKKYEEVLQTEKEKAILEKEAAALKKKEKVKSTKRFLLIFLALAIVVAGAIILIASVVKYNSALALMDEGKHIEAAMAFGAAGNYRDAKQQSKALWDEFAVRETVSAGSEHTAGLRSDGTVVAVGYNDEGQLNVSGWTDVIAVSAGGKHTVGLRSDGTVVATENVGGYFDYAGQDEVSDWRNIVAISAGNEHTVGLRSDGTVVAAGAEYGGRCDVSKWRNIVAISAGSEHTVGLRSDGTVVAVGDNEYGQCNVSNWTDIVAIAAGGYFTVGLRSDGTVVAVGDNEYGQCNVSDWTDIVDISTLFGDAVGLRSNGTVVTTAWGEMYDVSGLTDIVAISAGGFHVVGIRENGTIVTVESNSRETPCQRASSWTDIRTPNS